MWTDFSTYQWTWMDFGFIHLAVILGFLVLAIIGMLRFSSLENSKPPKRKTRSPSDVLRRRYAPWKDKQAAIRTANAKASRVTK